MKKRNAKPEESFIRLQPLIIREVIKRQKTFLARDMVSLPQAIILGMLSAKGECSMNELASYLSCTMSAVTPTIDKMLKKKVVSRKRSKTDRRVVNVRLLPKGRRINRKIDKARKAMTTQIFRALTEKEKRTYIRIANKIYEYLKIKNK